MDFTGYPTSHKHNSNYQAGQHSDQDEQFYSLSNDFQLNESAIEEFANLTTFINTHANISFPSADSSEQQMQMYLKSKKETKEQIANEKTTVYGDVRKNNQNGCPNNRNSSSSSQQFECKQLSPPSPNKVSLLNDSLKLSKDIGVEQKRKQEQGTIRNQKQQANIKNFDNSLEKTQLSDNFAMLPSMNLTLSQKTKSNGSQQFTDKNNNNIINGPSKNDSSKVDMRLSNERIFRIQGPDEVYQKLEKEKETVVEKEKKKEDQKLKIKNKVQQNLALAKTLIGEIVTNNEGIKKPIQILNSPVKKDENTIILSQLPNAISQQQFSCKSLIRLSHIPNLPNQLLQQSTSSTDFYRKYSFTLSKSQIEIQSVYTILIKQIYKIKIIYSEYNRPELKITFDDENNSGVLINRNSEINNKVSKKDDKDKDKEKQKIIYFCDSYQTIYAIFAWVVVRKLVDMGQNIVAKQSKNVQTRKSILSFDNKIEGIIYKRSQFLKNWQKRFVQISNFKLKSYRVNQVSPSKESKQKSNQQQSYKISTQCTFELDEIRQIWTRFQIMENKFLVMKMFKKNKLQKYELAIPAANYCDVLKGQGNGKQNQCNWLLGLVSMLKGQL